MHNYSRLVLNLMHSGKIVFFYFKKKLKSAKENHTLDSNVPESNLHGENEDQNHRSLVNMKSSTQ